MLLLILALTLGQVDTGRIIGGRVAAPHSRPYMVLIKQNLENNKFKHCGGFLLNEDFVMTAAHCKAKSYTVFLGLHDYNNKSERAFVHVAEDYPHPDYKSYKHDIMLLKLDSKANDVQNVKPIALAEENDNNDTLPTSCSTSGWGKHSKEKNDMSPKLREVNITLLNQEICNHTNTYCSDGDTGPAEGDSGGPLVCEDGKAYGVVSARHKNKYYYAKIPAYRSWIDTIINQTPN